MLAWLLAAFDLARLRGAVPPAVPLALHVLLAGACLAAALTGQAEGGRIPVDEQARPLLASHDAWATRLSFAAGGLLLLRLGLWRRRERPLAVALAVASLLLALGLLGTARLGGRLVFEHGAGVVAGQR